METHMFTRRTGRGLTALTAALLAMSCGGIYGGTAGPPPADNTVAATASLTFTPGALPVNVGETVTFAFGSVPHNVFFTQQTGVPADIAGNNTNVSITRTFATAGTDAYTCHIHPAMYGT